MSDPGYRMRPMTAAEISLAVEWAAAEGWNPGLADAACFHAADPEGYLIGLLDGEPAACISVVTYGETYGFLGFYIVRPELRGRGLGWAIWQAGMRRLGERVVGLDGVVAQQGNYSKSGFVLAHRNVRYGGTPADLPAPRRTLTPVAELPFEALAAYDTEFFPAPRDTFLRGWLRPEQRAGLAALDAAGRVVGYGVARTCRDGAKIGPLFADDPEIAEDLFRGLAPLFPGPVYLDPPEPNAAAVALAERHGLQPVFETARMYRGTAPQLPLDRIFGITTFELG